MQNVKNNRLHLYAFDIYESDKGSIIARSRKEAEQIFIKEYPENQSLMMRKASGIKTDC